MATIPFGTSHDVAHSLVLQSDGKVVVAGWTQSTNDRDFATARLNTNGSLDTGFGTGGKVVTPIGTNNEANAVTIDNWGRLTVAGYAVIGGVSEAIVARYFANGSLDTSFNGTGMKTVPGYTASAIQTVGSGTSPQDIIVAGTSAQPAGDDFTLSRLESTGPFHTYLNGTGSVITSTSAGYDRLNAMAIQSDGKIVVVGSTQVGSISRFLVIRYNGNGTLDASFNGTGRVSTNIGDNDVARSVAIQSDGKFVVVGSALSGSNVNMAVVRYNTNGSLDSGFGNGGIATTDFFGGEDSANAVAIQSDRKILVGGTAGNAVVFALARYQENGTLDPSFNGGKRSLDLGGGNQTVRGLAIMPDGRYVLAGSAIRNGANDFAVARFLNNTPSIATNPPSNIGKTSVRLNGVLNGNGGRTSIRVQYGETPSFGSNNPDLVLEVANGENIQIWLTGLQPNKTYHYRFVATNGSGTTNGTPGQFTTLADGPTLGSSPPVNVTANSATLTASVNPNSRETNVHFQYGLNPDFLTELTPIESLPAGAAPVSVTAQITGLYPNTVYFYRAHASNSAGFDETSTGSFSTVQLPAEVSATRAIGLTTTSAALHGTVRARNALTEVWIDYDTDTDFGNSIRTDPMVVSGDDLVEVRAVVTGLTQGTDYVFRVRAQNAGGQSLSAPLTFRTDILSGFSRVDPGPPPESLGYLIVNHTSTSLTHGWRFLGEQQWRAFGVPVGGLVSGDRVIEFRPLPGFIQPPNGPVTITSGMAATFFEPTYFSTGTPDTGGLNVILKPDSIIAGPDRGQWRLVGEGDEFWRDSGTTVTGLSVGTHLVECKPVPGKTTPLVGSIKVSLNETASAILTYSESFASEGVEPAPLAFETATQEPYAYLGQLRSSAGSGTGFVVKARVVATAAHVVWDEGTLSPVEGLEWHFQRHSGVHEPHPRIPRGFYTLSGYDEARRLEDSPGTFAPQSRNRDVAAVYFTDDAARGGYGGFLASDLDVNEFLLSNANKILVGYPINGVASIRRGVMHATSPFNVNFSPVPFSPLENSATLLPDARRLFLTTEIRSSGGASGGPILVQFEGGAYYPAAVYLGGSTQSIVRAIDSTVIELFDLAEESGIDGAPHTGGGITHSNVTTIGGAGDPGALRVVIEPAGAITAGAGWRLRPETNFRNSGDQRSGLNAGRYTLELAQAGGFQSPASQSVLIKGGQLTTLTFSYALLPVPASAITLRGNERSIGNGDDSPSALDGSDFGLAAVDGGTATRSFTISNPGTAELSLGSIALGGSHADDFSISIPPGASIPPGGSTTFTILFDPSVAGLRSATVSFATNVSGSNPFTFAIQGNDTTDSDNDGFTDVEETALADLLASFTVGQTIDLDLSFLRLGSGQVLELLNLPPGLGFDPGTNRITGTITGKAASPQVEIRKLDGADIVSSVTSDFPVFTPARLTVSGARPFPATRIGRRSKPQTLVVTNAGELALKDVVVRTTGRAAREFLVTQPATNTLGSNASTSFTITFKPRSKGNRSASVTIFSSIAPVSLPLSGKGK